ncbi:conserved hypothetical protein [Mesorhizobium sp. ORS 3359]|nr:conserved hypothetical protein [Mesorhizobium sp. ORS 3359]
MTRLWKDGNWAAVLGVAVFVAIGVLLWFTYHWDFGDLCAEKENGAECFRGWFGAAAGYLAVIAAGITLFALYDQIWEQRKQTEFMIGDANPTVDVMAEEFTYAYVQIVNWNRRTFLIDEIVPADGTLLFGSLEEVEIEGVKYAIPYEWTGEFETAQRLPGWLDRNSPPKLARFKVRAYFTDSGGAGRSPRREEITVVVSGRLVGDEHKSIALPAKTVLHSF